MFVYKFSKFCRDREDIFVDIDLYSYVQVSQLSNLLTCEHEKSTFNSLDC